MSSTATQAIEESVLAALLSVSGMTSAKYVLAFDDLFTPGDEDNTWAMAKPDSYPGCTFCLNKDEIKTPKEHRIMTAGQARVMVALPLYVAIVATSDGDDATTARDLAVQLTEATLLKLMATVPVGFPAAYSAAYGPFESEGWHEYLVDSKTHATLMRFTVQFQMAQ